MGLLKGNRRGRECSGEMFRGDVQGRCPGTMFVPSDLNDHGTVFPILLSLHLHDRTCASSDHELVYTPCQILLSNPHVISLDGSFGYDDA